MTKPLGGKAYGSIPHMSGSRMGIGDKRINPGIEALFTTRKKDKKGRKGRVIIQEKLDGACVSIAKIDNKIIPLMRAGYTAASSEYEHLRMFHDWAMKFEKEWGGHLENGERLCGEWLAMAHGIKYEVGDFPFVAFDLMRGPNRASYDEFENRFAPVNQIPYQLPWKYHDGEPKPLHEVIDRYCQSSMHGGENTEGVVLRLEREGMDTVLSKWVRGDHVCGKYFRQDIWNWRLV